VEEGQLDPSGTFFPGRGKLAALSELKRQLEQRDE
jgi:hypothetical protein